MPTPRLLLFGTPGAGKSALLGALAQAAPALKAEVIDKSGMLEELQKNTYADNVTPTQRTDVADLPVYLVLTKCDLLARKEDTFAKWLTRIDEGKRRVDEKFREYLKEQGAGFGTLKMRLWATSIKRPALADRPAQAQEPF